MKNLIIGLLAFGSMSAFAKTHTYKCYSYYWNGDEQSHGTMTLEVNNKTAKADIAEESWDDNLGGNLNSTYRSRGAIKYVKFGSELIVQESLLTGGTKLDDQSYGGFARVEGEAEGGFYQYKFICKR